MPDRCCNELGCRRKKPMMLMRGDLTNDWYVVTAYTERGPGQYRATTKHKLEPKIAAQLDEMRAALQRERERMEAKDA